jgi:hypothetical protein
MKTTQTTLSILLLLFMVGCSVFSTPIPTPQSADIRVVVVKGDQLPASVPVFEVIDLGQNQDWEDIDAVLISSGFLMKAKDDASLRLKLTDVAWQSILLIWGSTTQEAADILQLKSPTNQTSRNEYILVAVHVTQTQTLGGGVLSEGNSNSENVLSAIELYIQTTQNEMK